MEHNGCCLLFYPFHFRSATRIGVSRNYLSTYLAFRSFVMSIINTNFEIILNNDFTFLEVLFWVHLYWAFSID